MSRFHRSLAAVLFLVIGMLVGACGSSTEITRTTTTSAQLSNADLTETTTETATTTETPSETTTAHAAPPATSTTPAQSTVATMPNVVCMNLQAAQDKIQDAGVFFSRSRDATGAGRRQVVDSNWVVVSQTPAPGAPVTEGQAVLSVVKIGESSSC